MSDWSLVVAAALFSGVTYRGFISWERIRTPKESLPLKELLERMSEMEDVQKEIQSKQNAIALTLGMRK